MARFRAGLFLPVCTLALAARRLGYTRSRTGRGGAMEDLANTLLGIGSDELAWYQIALRAGVVYVLALGLIKIGDKRFIGQSTSIDLIIAIVLGNILAYAIIGHDTRMTTALVAAASLVVLHRLMGMLACRSPWLDDFLKGKPHVLIQKGELNRDNLRRTRISDEDLEMALHLDGKLCDMKEVALARFERNGQISIIRQPRQAQIVEVAVRDGVQVVRLEIGGGPDEDAQKPL
jgi:uncharacterized membrane protein YcaP (DUF421 family)